ncbi:ParB N-terminal domain-containing protein [Flavobacteriaceae bacterium]|jgi:ParB family transcriptional regulator, chromosome partitioning protein|nr:ParB N-terminal domain-containing protein [Flavobacteriaceae bacterium]MDB2341082.1 ParB N-terminal domain-containing protein [Flavobacteriaceae bacterium]MDB2695090.1 ParB N-terminal domain-containing protein [Flavobacteriaceae bacterium]
MGDKINDKEIVEISINKLENHPMNESIYSSRREQDDLELEQSISELGLLEPLTIIPKNKGYYIISGNRRFSALLRLGYKKISCRVVSDEHQIIKLIQHNKYREKTIIEKRNEIREVKNYLKSLSKPERKKFLEGRTIREYINSESDVSHTTLNKLDYIEKYKPEIMEDINLGLVSPTEGYQIVKSEVENRDVDTEFTVRNIESRIKKLSSIISKKDWEEMLDRIYG